MSATDSDPTAGAGPAAMTTDGSSLHDRLEEYYQSSEQLLQSLHQQIIERKRQQLLNRLVAEHQYQLSVRLYQLQVLGVLSGLMVGFSMTLAAQTNISPDLSHGVLIAFSLLSGLTIAANAICLVYVSLIYLAVLRFEPEEEQLNDIAAAEDEADADKPSKLTASADTILALKPSAASTSSFERFWLLRCQHSWQLSSALFLVSLPLFAGTVCLLGGVQFHQYLSATISVVVINAVAALYMAAMIVKWQTSADSQASSDVPSKR